MLSESDPTMIRSVAVKTADVVSALELNQTTSDHAVLRVTPPFSGRMRARLHVEQDGYDREPRPLHIEPELFVADPPAYPRPGDTADELRADPDETYTVDHHHDYHANIVDEWRQRIPDAICDQITLDTPAGPHDVDVALLGEL
jgi:hypothetical protein